MHWILRASYLNFPIRGYYPVIFAFPFGDVFPFSLVI
ncbi:unknown [Tannerella sp. CAG:118]|uniref:Uncharacterized protein n=1 Tax=Coprobacter secundus subsp. similis TaxID=2751153 RepID=A0A7G1HYC0_9BACT|nr:hypothetical protein Cop2CBH44_30030 [Coprobacter secundus subsp. similis]CCY37265.1 unknown [Tannerella sp. CAG:118]